MLLSVFPVPAHYTVQPDSQSKSLGLNLEFSVNYVCIHLLPSCALDIKMHPKSYHFSLLELPLPHDHATIMSHLSCGNSPLPGISTSTLSSL